MQESRLPRLGLASFFFFFFGGGGLFSVPEFQGPARICVV